MQISIFQALCLLPDSDTFKGFHVSHSRDQKLHYHRIEMTLDQVHEIAMRQHTAKLFRQRGRGILLRFGPLCLLKADVQKVKSHLKANDWVWKSANEGSGAA